MIFYFINGLNYGIDFRGGTMLMIKTSDDNSITEILLEDAKKIVDEEKAATPGWEKYFMDNYFIYRDK